LEADKAILKPPPAPRAIAENYGWQLMLTDGWAIAAGIFSILGFTFTGMGFFLTIGIVTAFVGLPFLGIGIVFLGLGLSVFLSRYQKAQRTLTVLRTGESTSGKIMSVTENFAVRVGTQHPWIIRYQFQCSAGNYQGEVATLQKPNLQPSQAVCVLYLPQSPQHNALYPHP